MRRVEKAVAKADRGRRLGRRLGPRLGPRLGRRLGPALAVAFLSLWWHAWAAAPRARAFDFDVFPTDQATLADDSDGGRDGRADAAGSPPYDRPILAIFRGDFAERRGVVTYNVGFVGIGAIDRVTLTLSGEVSGRPIPGGTVELAGFSSGGNVELGDFNREDTFVGFVPAFAGSVAIDVTDFVVDAYNAGIRNVGFLLFATLTNDVPVTFAADSRLHVGFVASVPEPASFVMLVVGVGVGLARFAATRKRKQVV